MYQLFTIIIENVQHIAHLKKIYQIVKTLKLSQQDESNYKENKAPKNSFNLLSTTISNFVFF